jgi:cell division protein FtsL
VSAPARTIVGTGPRGSAVPARSPAPPGTKTGTKKNPSHARPARPPAARPRTSTPPHPRRRARRGHTPAFWILTSVVVTAMVVGVVSLSALAVQASFRADALRAHIDELADRQQVLTEQVASLSSPARIAAWARRGGMQVPDHVVVLRVRDPDGGDGA